MVLCFVVCLSDGCTSVALVTFFQLGLFVSLCWSRALASSSDGPGGLVWEAALCLFRLAH